jgi:hypothetical protein
MATPKIDPHGVAMLVTVGLSLVTVGAMLLFKPALMLRTFPGGLQGKARRIFGVDISNILDLWDNNLLFCRAVRTTSYRVVLRGSKRACGFVES